ncbi:MAG: LPXTG cell wall anchor domain-containing protein [Coriobacteriia bacterium]|nr:LPXTG cell wall anchor domain-containing protein [Coriobacteriia bacterium]
MESVRKQSLALILAFLMALVGLALLATPAYAADEPGLNDGPKPGDFADPDDPNAGGGQPGDAEDPNAGGEQPGQPGGFDPGNAVTPGSDPKPGNNNGGFIEKVIDLRHDGDDEDDPFDEERDEWGQWRRGNVLYFHDFAHGARADALRYARDDFYKEKQEVVVARAKGGRLPKTSDSTNTLAYAAGSLGLLTLSAAALRMRKVK